MKQFLVLAILALPMLGNTQSSHAHGRVVRFPDIPGFVSLSCDFHIHTVFSDGSVWPDIRVQEAVKDSLDAISLTEHLEYQPHKVDIPHPDRNRSYEIASEQAKPYELIVCKGAEITRSMPPGHSNAIFIKDANKLVQDDALTVFREANKQGAFTFWNHPNWTAQRLDGIARLTDFHSLLIKDGLLHGIEVVNEMTYSDEALQIALDHNLTIMATSDIHGLVDWQFELEQGGHRPFTLVLAKERSEAGIKEALFARRTLAVYNHTLIGRAEWMTPVLQASLRAVKASYIGTSTVLDVTLENNSDMPLVLVNEGPFTLHEHAGLIMLESRARTTIQVKTKELLDSFSIPFRVMNAVTAPGKYAAVVVPVTVGE